MITVHHLIREFSQHEALHALLFEPELVFLGTQPPSSEVSKETLSAILALCERKLSEVDSELVELHSYDEALTKLGEEMDAG